MLFSLPYRYEEERLKARRERSVQSSRARAGWGLAPGWARVCVGGGRWLPLSGDQWHAHMGLKALLLSRAGWESDPASNPGSPT